MSGQHGGRVLAAARRHGIAPARWLDLSTGINPRGYPVPVLAASHWHRLPEPDDALHARAADYYGSAHLLAVAGSQAAIAWLPRLRRCCRVAIVGPTYSEHARQWRLAGHEVLVAAADRVEAALTGPTPPQVVVCVRPDNPTGQVLPAARLARWQARLSATDGWLIVDEAFVDATPQLSLAGRAGVAGLIVLRSLGKFFGLPGARVGFVFAWPALLAALAEVTEPWGVAGPARAAATAALADVPWQRRTRQWLPRQAAALDAVLHRAGVPVLGGTSLFRYCRWPEDASPAAGAAVLAARLARRGILLRRFVQPSALRIGLPAGPAALARLQAVLEEEMCA